MKHQSSMAVNQLGNAERMKKKNNFHKDIHAQQFIYLSIIDRRVLIIKSKVSFAIIPLWLVISFSFFMNFINLLCAKRTNENQNERKPEPNSNKSNKFIRETGENG